MGFNSGFKGLISNEWQWGSESHPESLLQYLPVLLTDVTKHVFIRELSGFCTIFESAARNKEQRGNLHT